MLCAERLHPPAPLVITATPALPPALPACSVPEGTQATATFLAKAPGVLAGVWVAHAVFARVDPAVSLTWHKKDGDTVQPGDILGEARGSARCVPPRPAAGGAAAAPVRASHPRCVRLAAPSSCACVPARRSIIVAERVALNFMQRMSGVATLTRRMVDEAQVRRGWVLCVDGAAAAWLLGRAEPGLAQLRRGAARAAASTARACATSRQVPLVPACPPAGHPHHSVGHA